MTIGYANFYHYLNSAPGRVLSLSLLALLYSPLIGVSDLGYRAASIDLKLSQKYPPAVALEVIHSKAQLEDPPPMDSFLTVIQLRAEYPDLGLISLDELSFKIQSDGPSTQLSEFSSKYPQPHADRSFANRSMASSYTSEVVTGAHPEDYFTEEEKLRLKMANLSNEDLNLDEVRPQEDTGLKEKIRAIIAQQGYENNTKSNPLSHPSNPSNPPSLPPRFPVSIRGDIEFSKDSSEALALTDKHFIDVRRFEEGIPKEVAQVNLVNGTFTINLQSTKGVLVGRLTSKSGGVDGEGKISVIDLMNSSNPRLILKRPPMAQPQPKSLYGNDWNKTPTPRGDNKHDTRQSSKGSNNGINPKNDGNGFVPTMMLAGTPVQKSTDDPPNKGSNTLSDTGLKLFNNNFDRSSEFILEVQADHHRPTVAISNIAKASEISLLPDRMINGLSEILLEQDISLNLDRGDSLIWGIVKDQGRPVEGATVMAGQGARTSYFGGFYLPDQTRTKTSENGMFSITLSNPGWNELLVELTDGRRIHINTLVFSGKVSQVEADIPKSTSPLILRSFDAFTGEPLRTNLEIQQLEQPIDTGLEGTANVEAPTTNNLSFVLVSPESPYEKIRLSYMHLEDYLHIPLFTKNWMDEFRSYLKVSDEPQTGNVVGFIQGDDFTVEVQNKVSSSKVVYFDQQGHFSNQGLAGGGFIVFNLEEDQVNLTLISKRNNKEIVRIVRPEKEWTHVINANFE